MKDIIIPKILSSLEENGNYIPLEKMNRHGTDMPKSYRLESPSLEISSVQFSCSVVSDALQPLELQHARPPCPSPAPGVHSHSHPSSQ